MIEIIKEKISDAKLRAHLNNPFPEMIKFVVDVEKEILALGGEMHADINIRPSQNNRSLDIQDERLKNKIKDIVYKLLPL